MRTLERAKRKPFAPPLSFFWSADTMSQSPIRVSIRCDDQYSDACNALSEAFLKFHLLVLGFDPDLVKRIRLEKP